MQGNLEKSRKLGKYVDYSPKVKLDRKLKGEVITYQRKGRV
jgi:hypothetical protein